MNKKQMLKEQKRLKEERRQTERLFNDDKEVYNVFKIGLGVILFIGLFFVAINIFNGNWNIFSKENKDTTDIDSNMLIVGTMFNKEEAEYFVLAYDISDENSDVYKMLWANYNDERKLYLLDLSSGFNRDFIGEKTVISNDLSKLKFGGPTLLLINKDQITKSYTEEEAIINELSNN